MISLNKFSYRVTYFVAILLITLIFSCQKKNGPKEKSLEITPPAQISPSSDQGASSGGGGYVTKNSKKLLSLVVDEIANEIKNASPFLFDDLPKGWDQLKLYNVLTNIRLNSTKDVQRDNSDLLFNYGIDEKGPYIEALRPYFLIYGHVPMDFREVYKSSYSKEGENSFKAMVLDLKLKLLHEMSHLLGKNEAEAEKFSLELLKKLEEDFYVCLAPRDQLISVPNILWVSPLEEVWIENNNNGRRVDCEGPKTNCVQRYEFNWIYTNGWIFHQSKEEMYHLERYITFHSHLDPTPLETIIEKWRGSTSAPGIRWENDFSNVLPLIKKTNKSFIEFIDKRKTPENNEKDITISVRVNYLPLPSNDKVFQTATVKIPVTEINSQTTPELVTGYNNPIAPRGKLTGESHEYQLKCDYFGILKQK